MNPFTALLLVPALILLRVARWLTDGNRVAMPGWIALLLSLASWVGLAFLIASLTGCAGSTEKHAAEREAKAWAAELHITPTSISCADYDSDDNGYVSCTLVIGTDLKQIECRSAYAFGHGCRDPKMPVRVNGGAP